MECSVRESPLLPHSLQSKPIDGMVDERAEWLRLPLEANRDSMI